MRAAAALLFVTLAAAPALAQPTVPQIMRLEGEANTRCRGGSGDVPETQQACGAREAYGRVLNMMNWCYGRRNEIGAQQRWHRCEANSNRFN